MKGKEKISYSGQAYRKSQNKKDSIIIGITGMTDKPYIAVFPILSIKEIEDALNDLAWKLKGIDDHISSARYKRDLLRKIGKLTVKEAYKCQKR